MVSLDVLVPYDPKGQLSKIELDEIIKNMDNYASITGESAVVALRQNNQYGCVYRIVSTRRAKEKMKDLKGPEFYVAYFPRSYFVLKKTKLKINDFLERIYNYIKTYSSPL